MYSSLLFLIIFSDSIYLTEFGRIFFAMLLGIGQLTFSLSQIFPRWEKRSPMWFTITSNLPGTVLIFLTIFTDFIINKTEVNNNLVLVTYGKLFPLYLSMFGVYFLGCYFTLLFKSKSLENESFRVQLFHFIMGINFGSLIFLILSVILPIFYNNDNYRNIGVSISGISLLVVSNYAVSDERLVNFNKFYLRILFWLAIFTFLFVPVFFGLEFGTKYTFYGYKIPSVLSTLFLIIYLSLFYKYGKPQVEWLFKRNFLEFRKNFNKFLQGITSLSFFDNEKAFSEDLFTRAIDGLVKKFGVSWVSLYLYNAKKGEYSYSHGFGETDKSEQIDIENNLIENLQEYHHFLEKSMIFTDDSLSEYRESLLKFFKQNDIQVILPLFNNVNEIIGILLLGRQKNNKPYSIDFLSLLELYRIEFGISISNAILMHEEKATQIINHDKMFVSSIKKRIIPKALNNIDGIRLSSFYLNNSEHGGDYFDSIIINPEHLGVILTNASDSGVDSGILLLEMFSILNTQKGKDINPDRLLNTLNRIIYTSSFSDKYANAFYFIYSSSLREIRYSNSSYNPLIIFDKQKEKFKELDVKGIPLGIDRNSIYKSQSIKVSSDEIGFIYSKGITSALNKNGENYSIGRIKDIIRLNRNDAPAVLSRKIYVDFKSFTENIKNVNDASLIIFKIQ